MRRAQALAAAIALALTLAAGCGSDEPAPHGTPAATVPSPSAPPPSQAGPTQPAPTVSPPPSAPTTPATPAALRIGDRGEDVTALQDRLIDLGYWTGGADGTFGSATQQAVFALQKAAGLDRDGVAGPDTGKALARGVRPAARSRTGHVIEIDLRRQILMIVNGGRVDAILNTSTGSNQHYEYEGETYLAVTPRGRFTASRQIDGWRHGPLGPLWRPKYFNGGIAVHGAFSVPPYPASHGCARVSIAAMNWIWSTGRLPLRTRVWVY